jgi:hypothetical protein
MMIFYRTVFVGIIVGLLIWSLRQPAEKLEDGGIVLKNSKVVYVVVALPVIGLLVVLPLALAECGMSVESLYLVGISVFVTLLYAWFVMYLNNQKIIATSEGVMGKKRKRSNYLKWADVKNVRYNGLNGRMKLIGEAAEITVNLEMVGGVEFLNTMREKLPAVICEEAVEKAGRRMKRYGFR